MAKTTKQNFKDINLKNQERIREIISNKLEEVMKDIQDLTGYYVQSEWSIYEDELRKTIDIDIPIALLARPHYIDERKVKHYLKWNPDNCLNEKIFAFRWDSWYEIYNGVHRTECARRMGKKMIKADIILPDEETLKERKLICS